MIKGKGFSQQHPISPKGRIEPRHLMQNLLSRPGRFGGWAFHRLPGRGGRSWLGSLPRSQMTVAVLIGSSAGCFGGEVRPSKNRGQLGSRLVVVGVVFISIIYIYKDSLVKVG